MRSKAVESAGPVREKFSSSAGRWLGFAAALMGLVLLGGAIAEGLTTYWRLGASGVALALLSWAVMIRPSVAAHEHGLLLRNVVRDIYVPWASIERCKALQTLQVATPDGIFHGLGVSRSARSMMRQEVGGRSVMGTMLGFRSGPTPASTARANEEVRTTTSYVEFIESRIINLAEGSRGQPAPVVTAPAPVPIAALAAALVVVLAVLFL